MSLNVLETRSGKWVSFARISGYTNSREEAEVFISKEEAVTLLSQDERYSWLVGKSFEYCPALCMA